MPHEIRLVIGQPARFKKMRTKTWIVLRVWMFCGELAAWVLAAVMAFCGELL
jgi:hypothetical protein